MSDEKLTKFKKLYRENGRKRDELTRFVDKNPDHAKELWNEIKYFLNNPAAKQRDGINARESLAVTADFIDQDSIEKDKPLFFKHCWKMYLETDDAAALADACLNASFFGQSEMGPTIANLLVKNKKTTKYAKALNKIVLDRMVHEYAQQYGAKAYEKLAEDKVFKNTQGVNSGKPKNAETFEREHKRWQAEQKKAK